MTQKAKRFKSTKDFYYYVCKSRDIRVIYSLNFNNELEWFNFHFGHDDEDCDEYHTKEDLLMDMYVKYTRNITNPLKIDSLRREWMLDVIDIYIQLLNN